MSFREAQAPQGIVLIPWFTLIDQFADHQFNTPTPPFEPEHVMYSYPAGRDIAAAYEDALNQMRATATGIVNPASGEGRATLNAVRGRKQ